MADGQGSKGYETGLLVWMGELMKADGEDSDGKDVLLLYQLRDLVMDSAMGNGTYPPCSDVMGVRAHYEAMVDEAFTIGLNDDDVSLLGIDSANTALDAINAAVAFFEDGKGDGKGKGDGNGSKEWLERLLTVLMEAGWCGNNAKGKDEGKGKDEDKDKGKGNK